MKQIIKRTQRIGAYVLATAMIAGLSVTAIAAAPEENEAASPPAQVIEQRADGGMNGRPGSFGDRQKGEERKLDEESPFETPDGEAPEQMGERPEGRSNRSAPDGEIPETGGKMNGKHGGFEDAIEAVEDEATREKLTALQEAVHEAMDAEHTAKQNGEDTEALREAVKAAREALEAALSDAGIEVQQGRMSRGAPDSEIPPEKQNGEKPDTVTPPEKSAESGETAGSGGMLDQFGEKARDWLHNIFGESSES